MWTSEWFSIDGNLSHNRAWTQEGWRPAWNMWQLWNANKLLCWRKREKCFSLWFVGGRTRSRLYFTLKQYVVKQKWAMGRLKELKSQQILVHSPFTKPLLTFSFYTDMRRLISSENLFVGDQIKSSTPYNKIWGSQFSLGSSLAEWICVYLGWSTKPNDIHKRDSGNVWWKILCLGNWAWFSKPPLNTSLIFF